MVNTFSFFMIVIGCFLFNFALPTILLEMGLKKKMAKSLIAALFLPFLFFLAGVLYPFFVFGYFVIADIGAFYTTSGGLLLWMAIAFLIGGLARFAFEYIRENKHK